MTYEKRPFQRYTTQWGRLTLRLKLLSAWGTITFDLKVLQTFDLNISLRTSQDVFIDISYDRAHQNMPNMSQKCPHFTLERNYYYPG
jgi:hypothetical protein